MLGGSCRRRNPPSCTLCQGRRWYWETA
jgi:hypothetical protein